MDSSLEHKILNWRGDELKCDIDESVFEHGGRRKEFFDKYVSSLSDAVGFKENPFEGLYVRNWNELFGEIRREFKSQSFLKDMFGSFGNFFNAFFLAPYGFSYRQDGDDHIFSDDFDSLTEESRHIAEYVRTINLPLLLYSSIQAHKEKYETLLGDLSERNLSKQSLLVSDSSGFLSKSRGKLTAEFSKNYWYNVFSNSDDCIFITKQRSLFGKDKIVFQKYWFASLLHMLHPNIYYLNFVAQNEGNHKGLKDKYNFPIYHAKLMRTESKEHPMIVGGILGPDFNRFETLCENGYSLKEFVDSTLWTFFEAFKQKLDLNGNLLHNQSHVLDARRPYNQFNAFLESNYGDDLRDDPLELSVSDQGIGSVVSNVRDGKYLFAGEYYSETFSFPNPPDKNEKRLGAFVSLKGLVNATAISDYQPFSDNGPTIVPEERKLFKNIFTVVAAVPLILGLSFGGLYLSAENYIGEKVKNVSVFDAMAEANTISTAQFDGNVYGDLLVYHQTHPCIPGDDKSGHKLTEEGLCRTYKERSVTDIEILTARIWPVLFSPEVYVDGVKLDFDNNTDARRFVDLLKTFGHTQDVVYSFISQYNLINSSQERLDYYKKLTHFENVWGIKSKTRYLGEFVMSIEDSHDFFIATEKIFNVSALYYHSKVLERYAYTRAAFCGLISDSAIARDLEFCGIADNPRRYSFHFGPCVCYSDHTVEDDWDMIVCEYSDCSDLYVSPLKMDFQNCEEYDCAFSLSSEISYGQISLSCEVNLIYKENECKLSEYPD